MGAGQFSNGLDFSWQNLLFPKLRILFIAPRYHANQINTVRTLLQHGHEVHFHVRTKGFTEDHSLIEPTVFPESSLTILLRRLFGDGGANRKRYMPSPIIYWKGLRQLKPDLVVIRKHGMAFTYLAATYALMLKCRIIFYNQADTIIFERLNHKSFFGALRKCKFFFPLRLFRAAWITPLLNKRHDPSSLPAGCYYLPFTVEIRRKSCSGNSSIRFLVIGKYIPRKNHILVVKAAKKLVGKYNFTITMVGEVHLPEHKIQRKLVYDEVQSSDLKDRVSFKDNISYSNMGEIYSKHDVFLLPARNEPAAISPLEAMGFGLPVICTDSCGTKTYIENGINGFIIETDNEDSLMQKMGYFLEDTSSVEIMSEKVCNYAKESLSAENFYKMFQTIVYKEFNKHKSRN